MNTKQQISALRTAALALAAAAMLAACSDEEFVRDAGQLPAEAGSTPTGALYARGSFDPRVQDFAISENTTVEVVYRLSFPAPTDVTVTLSLGDQYDIDAYNDAQGIKDGNTGTPMIIAPYQRYRMLPESNFTLPETLTLTVEKGRTESAPLAVEVVYDDNLLPSDFAKRMLWPWMLPLRVEKVEGEVVPAADQMLGIGIRPANKYDSGIFSSITKAPIEEYLPKDVDFKFITYCDCREFDPSYAIYYYYGQADFQKGSNNQLTFVPETVRHSPLFDVEILHPAFIAADKNGMPVVEPSTDLMYVLTHQERYVDPQRKFWMKICVSLETVRKSPVGLCNLSDQARETLVWQIAEMVKTYRLDGVALNDKPADYAAAGAPAVDRGSYTRFLKALREALGPDKLIMVSYDADENAALYEAHDGLQAGDYIDYAWWGTENEFCTPYDPAAPTCRPIAGLPVNKFSPMAANAVETEVFTELFLERYTPSGIIKGTALKKLKELNDKGQCSVLVYLTLRPNVQGFYEGAYEIIPETFGGIPHHEGDKFDIPGWYSGGGVSRVAMRNLPHFMGYGSGLKDW